jgi:hypothetical protein
MTKLKQEILQRIERAYSEFTHFVTVLDVEAIHAKPGEQEWTIKDILAHVAAWEDVLVRFHLSGERFEDVIGLSGAEYRVTPFDEINQHLYEKYREWSLEKVKKLAQETHQELVGHLAQISDDELREPSRIITALGLDPYPMFEYIAANTYDHYSEHLETMKGIADQAN